MNKLKRIPIKYIRDRAKSRYKKDDSCFVCGSNKSLDFHHLYTVDVLVDNWFKKKKITINDADDIIAVRDDFIAEHEYEMFEYAKTLCKSCHQKLHSIYGSRPALSTADKQFRWLEKQRQKRLGRDNGGHS